MAKIHQESRQNDTHRCRFSAAKCYTFSHQPLTNFVCLPQIVYGQFSDKFCWKLKLVNCQKKLYNKDNLSDLLSTQANHSCATTGNSNRWQQIVICLIIQSFIWCCQHKWFYDWDCMVAKQHLNILVLLCVGLDVTKGQLLCVMYAFREIRVCWLSLWCISLFSDKYKHD